MDTILHKFGHCVIPTGSLLFRGFRTDILDSPMFFMTKFGFASKAPGGLTQVWQVKRNLQVLFMIGYLNQYARAYSSIREVYSSIFPEEFNHKYSDLDIKQHPTPLREKFIGRLLALGINGWFSSLEDNQEVEVCLFQPADGDIRLIDKLDPDSGKYFRDSMKKFELFPPQSFFVRTRKNLTASSSVVMSDDQLREKYKRHHTRLLDECMHGSNDQHEREVVTEMYHNLRVQLNL